MDGSVVDLSKYRLERSKDDLETAESNLKDHRYSASVNRAYYAIFHALRAITALDHSLDFSGITTVCRLMKWSLLFHCYQYFAVLCALPNS